MSHLIRQYLAESENKGELSHKKLIVRNLCAPVSLWQRRLQRSIDRGSLGSIYPRMRVTSFDRARWMEYPGKGSTQADPSWVSLHCGYNATIVP
jgi:hypothetical protein